MKTCATIRFRDIIAETVQEYSRMENFCRIFPARNSKLYDKYFAGHKPLNKILYKVLYTSEILAYEKSRIEQSAHPIPSKANALLAQQQMHSTTSKSVLSSDGRLHSSTGARPIRSSKSNSKLMLQT